MITSGVHKPKANMPPRGERGASFSFALLLLLVCVVVGTVVLTAATASSGRLAEAGKADKRYYSVASASQLFRDNAEGREFALVERRSTTISNIRTSDTDIESLEDDAWGEVEIVSIPQADSNEDFDFLADVTRSALLGGEDPEEGSWLTGAPEATLPVEYTVTPDLSSLPVDSDDYIVKVDGRLRTDWTLELDFHNVAPRNAPALGEAETFHLTVILAADVDNYIDTTSALDATTITGTVSNGMTVTQTKTTTITWRVQSVIPGKGLADV